MSQNPSHLETRVLQGHNRAKQTVVEQFSLAYNETVLSEKGNHVAQSERLRRYWTSWVGVISIIHSSFTLSTVRFMLDHLVIAIFIWGPSSWILVPHSWVVSVNMDRPLWKSNSDLPQFFRSWPCQNLLKNILNFTYFTYLNKFLGFSVDG